MSENTDVDIVVEPTPAENEAKTFGWVPLDEFKGDPEDWRDADTFLKRGKEINGFLRKDLEKLKSNLMQKDAEIREVKETMAEFAKFHKETEERAYKRAIEDIRKQKAEAVNVGDGEAVVALDEQLDALKEAQKQAATPVTTQKQNTPSKEYLSWVKSNIWFETDPELRALANVVSQEITLDSPGLPDAEYLQEITKRVKESAPEKFENPNRRTSAVTGSSDGRAPTQRTDKKSYDNLPAEAKAACDKFVKNIKGYTREDYLKDYDWS